MTTIVETFTQKNLHSLRQQYFSEEELGKISSQGKTNYNRRLGFPKGLGIF